MLLGEHFALTSRIVRFERPFLSICSGPAACVMQLCAVPLPSWDGHVPIRQLPPTTSRNGFPGEALDYVGKNE